MSVMYVREMFDERGLRRTLDERSIEEGRVGRGGDEKKEGEEGTGEEEEDGERLGERLEDEDREA